MISKVLLPDFHETCLTSCLFCTCSGLHYSVRLEEIFLCVLYRAELVLKLSKESTAKVCSYGIMNEV